MRLKSALREVLAVYNHGIDFSDSKMSINRELHCQIALLEKLKELNLDFPLENNAFDEEILQQSIFEFEYRSLNREGFQIGRKRKVFRLKKSNLFNLENGKKTSVNTVDQLLLERYGLNVIPKLHQNDAPEYEPKPIFRRIAIDWGSFYAAPMYGISVEGVDTTFLEVSWSAKDESSELFDEIRKTDPEFRLVDENQHKKMTQEYNKRLIRAMKGNLMISAMRIMDDSTGHYRNPFDFRGFTNLRREIGSIPNVNKNNYLQSNEWLDQIDDTLGGWAYSSYQIQKVEMEELQEFWKESLERMTSRLHLENTRLWSDEPGVHLYYLKVALNNYRSVDIAISKHFL